MQGHASEPEGNDGKTKGGRMIQLTKEQAIKFAKSKAWECLSLEQRFLFQVQQRRLCMPFGKFHEATESALGRGVYTHEFVDPDSLLQEYLGEKEAPSLQDIIEMIPAKKRIVIINE